jgi:integrase
VLHSIFAYAERRGLVAGNVCKLVDKRKPAVGNGRIRFLSPAELDELLAAAEAPTGAIAATDRVLYLTAAFTGLRQGELLALRWRDVDWHARRIRVRESLVRGEFTTPKSRRGHRAVPLATRVADALAAHRERSAFAGPEDLVFCHPLLGRPRERSRLCKRFKAVAVAAGFPALRFHDLRHTFGTRMAAAGVPLRTLQEWMGHRDFKTTLIYADYQPRDDEAELVDQALES